MKSVREWADVKREARCTGRKVHIARVFNVCVEKGSELPEGHSGRKYTSRFVYDGADVTDDNRQVAMFNELSSHPATMEGSKATDAYGLMPGHSIEGCDAEQAYTQTDIGNLIPTHIECEKEEVTTWRRLPRANWPPEWEGMVDPVVIMVRALYGHPDAGGLLGTVLRWTRAKRWMAVNALPQIFKRILS